MKKINITVADPAGNITVFVNDFFPRNEYQHIAKKILDIPELKAEQVAFVTPADDNCDGSFEMCGLEFCGNATRSFGLITACRLERDGDFIIKASGADKPLTVNVQRESSYTKVFMPLPCGIDKTDNGTLVDLGGIVHLDTDIYSPTEENFAALKESFYSDNDAPAFGVMFCAKNSSSMIPAVYVKDVDTTYFEGSCGSGTTACSAAFSLVKADGTYTYELVQPEGTIISSVTISDGSITAVTIEGAVGLKENIEIEI